jgi:hypothetical protein
MDAWTYGIAIPTVKPSLPALPRPHVDPHALPQRKLSKAARAVLGAEILDGNIALLNPTRTMVATAVGVSTTYVDAARRLSPEARQEVVRGMRSLARRK